MTILSINQRLFTWSSTPHTRNIMDNRRYVAVDSTKTQHVSRVFNRILNIVDSPGGNPENEPELATATVETTGRRGATQAYIFSLDLLWLITMNILDSGNGGNCGNWTSQDWTLTGQILTRLTDSFSRLHKSIMLTENTRRCVSTQCVLDTQWTKVKIVRQHILFLRLKDDRGS